MSFIVALSLSGPWAVNDLFSATIKVDSAHSSKQYGTKSRGEIPRKIVKPIVRNGIVFLSAKDRVAKKRPKGYGKVKLSATKLRKRLSAKSAVIMDANSESILYSHAADVPAQPASTIKVLTGLIAIKSLTDKELVSVSRRASRMPRSKIYLRKGRQYPADDLVNAVLLASANDASVALAERIAGSEDKFAEIMTNTASRLGAANTVCKTASGLTARGQRSTARDLARIFNMAMADTKFAGKMSRRRIKNINGGMVYSHNKALWRITGTLGGKTGYTNKARQTYVGKFKRKGTELVVAFLGSETMWKDAKRLVEYGFAKSAELKELAAAKSKRILPVVLGEHARSENPLVLSNLRQ